MAESSRSVVIHGHFYQPPREDPWLEMLEAQPSAAPRHDWNERVDRECYRAVATARVLGPQGRIQEIRNTLRHISFNFGPTLLQWMAENAPRSYSAILEADRRSRARLAGHGNAIAQACHHTILPLASRREKVTEVRWGIADFRRRFGRDPAGMWLPETAVDGETLEILAQEGIAFTIVAPHQVEPVPGEGLPGLFRTSRGQSIALFVYDGKLSHGVAFGSLLRDAGEWAAAMVGSGESTGGRAMGEGGARRLVAIATDGETYGHHHRFGEMALAAVLRRLGATKGVRLENFSSFLHRNPPVEEVRLIEPSSWSCAHGVERWRTECGCRMHPSKPTQQEWRTPLRRAMDDLSEGLHRIYLEEAPPLLGDPWAARDDYGSVVGEEPEALGVFVRARAPRHLEPQEETRAAELLEMERNALRLFTSCGWFFDDLAGIEVFQVLRYAARAIELAGPEGWVLEEAFLSTLAKARTNEEPPRNGRTLFQEEVRPSIRPHLAVGAGAAALHALEEEIQGHALGRAEYRQVPGYRAVVEKPRHLAVSHRRTGRQWELGYEVLRPEPSRIEVKVWPAGQAHDPLSFEASDLPEAFRIPVATGLREVILKTWAPGTLSAAGVEDEGGFRALAAQELVTAIQALDRDQGDPALAKVRDLARLQTLLGLPIPFDAQTDFYRILQASSPEEQRRLGVLREPLGFVLPS